MRRSGRRGKEEGGRGREGLHIGDLGFEEEEGVERGRVKGVRKGERKGEGRDGGLPKNALEKSVIKYSFLTIQELTGWCCET